MEDPDLELEWERVLASWNDAEAHKRFLVLADASDRLALAGRRYRAIKDEHPDRRAEAEKRVGEILTLALARMHVEKTEPQKMKSRLEWVAFGVSAALIAAALWQVLRSM